MNESGLFYQARWRSASWYAGVMGCILTLCGIGVYHIVAHAYRQTIDQALESVAEALHSSIEPILQRPEQLQPLARQLSLEFCHTQTSCLTKPTKTNHSILAVVESVNYYLRLSDSTGKPIALAGLPLGQLPITKGAEHWHTLRTRSGIWYRQISLPLHTQNQLWGYVQVGRSLTDLEQHLAALRLTLLLGGPVAMLLIGCSSWWLAGLAMQPVYRSYQQMYQFTADAAHELRTPLAAMQSTIESALLQQERSSDASPELVPTTLTILKRQNIRLSQLVKDLLLLARIDQQSLSKQRSVCCLNDLIDDLIEEMASLAIAAKVTLKAQVQEKEPIYVLGNEQQLYRLVCNLIDNALKSTPEGGKVTVVLTRSEIDAIIQIQDNGIGIALEAQARIFDRFYRVQSDRSRHTGGAGLGLPIAQAIAQAHHGSIQVQSQPGKGSSFTVQLPLLLSAKN